jgi:Uma2 family endonuclease
MRPRPERRISQKARPSLSTAGPISTPRPTGEVSMTTELQPTTADDLEAEPDEPTYRLSVAQYHRMRDEGILLDPVELVEGQLYRKNAGSGPPSGWFYRLTVDQYRAMARSGILTPDDRVELLEGWLVAKMTKLRSHVVSTMRTFSAITALIPAGWFVAKEDPVLAFESEPEPDISIVRGDIGDYLERTPGPLQVALVVEVADSSLQNDRSMKKRLYARSGFPIYWLINLVDHRIEVYTEPTGPVEEPEYLHRQDFGPDEMIPLVIEGREVGRLAARDLLP